MFQDLGYDPMYVDGRCALVEVKMILNKFRTNRSRVVAALESLTRLCNKSKNTILMANELNLVGDVLSTIDRNMWDRSVRYAASQSMCSLVKNNVGSTLNLRDEGLIDNFVSLMQVDIRDADTLQYACEAVARLSTSQANLEYIFEKGGTNTVLHSLSHNLCCSSLQVAGMHALIQFSKFVPCHDAILSRGGISIVISNLAFAAKSNLPGLARMGLLALFAFSQNDISKNAIVRSGGISAALSVIPYFKHDPQIIHIGLLTLHVICRGVEEHINILYGKGGVGVILSCLVCLPDNNEICVSGLQTLRTLYTRNDNKTHHTSAQELCELTRVLAILCERYFLEPRMLLEVCLTIECVCMDPGCWSFFVKHGLVQDLVKSMVLWNCNPNLLIQGISTFSYLLSLHKNVKNQGTLCGVIDAIVTGISKHREMFCVVSIGLRVFDLFKEDISVVQNIVALGGINICLGACSSFCCNEGFVEQAVTTAASLLKTFMETPDLYRRFALNGNLTRGKTLPGVFECMLSYPCNARIQSELYSVLDYVFKNNFFFISFLHREIKGVKPIIENLCTTFNHIGEWKRYDGSIYFAGNKTFYFQYFMEKSLKILMRLVAVTLQISDTSILEIVGFEVLTAYLNFAKDDILLQKDSMSLFTLVLCHYFRPEWYLLAIEMTKKFLLGSKQRSEHSHTRTCFLWLGCSLANWSVTQELFLLLLSLHKYEKHAHLNFSFSEVTAILYWSNQLNAFIKGQVIRVRGHQVDIDNFVEIDKFQFGPFMISNSRKTILQVFHDLVDHLFETASLRLEATMILQKSIRGWRVRKRP